MIILMVNGPLHAFCRSTTFETSTVPSDEVVTRLTQLCEEAFAGCTSLTSVVFPDSLKQVGDTAFGDCSPLTSMVLPDSLTQLGNAAFQGCTFLTSVKLPD